MCKQAYRFGWLLYSCFLNIPAMEGRSRLWMIPRSKFISGLQGGIIAPCPSDMVALYNIMLFVKHKSLHYNLHEENKASGCIAFYFYFFTFPLCVSLCACLGMERHTHR